MPNADGRTRPKSGARRFFSSSAIGDPDARFAKRLATPEVKRIRYKITNNAKTIATNINDAHADVDARSTASTVATNTDAVNDSVLGAEEEEDSWTTVAAMNITDVAPNIVAEGRPRPTERSPARFVSGSTALDPASRPSSSAKRSSNFAFSCRRVYNSNLLR